MNAKISPMKNTKSLNILTEDQEKFQSRKAAKKAAKLLKKSQQLEKSFILETA